MPETYGQPEPEPTKTERFSAVIAGRGVVRRTILYTVLGFSLGAAYFLPFVLLIGMVAFVLLMATDSDLS